MFQDIKFLSKDGFLFKTVIAALLCGALAVPNLGHAEDAAEDPLVKKAQQEEALAKAQEAKYKAEKAAIEAKAAVALAPLENFPKSDAASGAVESSEKPGQSEAFLLSASAVRETAIGVADAGKAIGAGQCGVIVPWGGGEDSALGKWQGYDARRLALGAAFSRIYESFKATEALREALPAAKQQKDKAVGPLLNNLVGEIAPVAAAIDAAARLGSFFQTDYEIKGVSITADESLLREAVSNELIGRGFKVKQASRFASSKQYDLLNKDLQDLDVAARAVGAAIDQADRWAKIYREAAAKAPKDAALEKLANNYERIASMGHDSLADYANLVTYVTGTSAEGASNFRALLAGGALHGALAPAGNDKTCVLMLKLNDMGGTLYTKKNAWTFLGSMPFYLGGVSTVSYTYINPEDSSVLAAGVAGRVTKYKKLHEIKGF